MSNPHTEIILRALHDYRGGDYIRAQNAFRGRTPEQMARPYGASGKTCQQILDEYRAHHDRVTAAIEWVRSLQ